MKHGSVDGFQGNYAVRTKSQYQNSCILWDSIYIKFLKWQNYRDGEQISECHGLGTGWWSEYDLKG